MLTLTAMSSAFQHFYADKSLPQVKTLHYQIVFNLSLWLWWALIYPLLYYFSVQIKEKKGYFSSWIVYVIILPVVLSVLHQTFATIIRYQYPVPMDFISLLGNRIFRFLSIWVDWSVYLVIMISLYLIDFQKTFKANEIKLAKLQNEYVQSKLHALKSQLHPHFLFNTLNTLSTLILKNDNAEAERMIALLNGFLKTTLQEGNILEVTLADELQYIRQYLEIEKVRFSDKLTVQEDLEPEALLVKVPSFLLQPIVENSIHHAIAKRTSDGRILISAKLQHEKLYISVEDNGPGNGSGHMKKSKEGIGLKVTRDRLQYLFAEMYELTSRQTETGGLCIQIVIPQY
ncbi:MAG: histidine kinase [Ignavibacteriales bacterium]|nr:histidine kinase [Ignavibacteriales bacterium]